jgi:hypothetical protein
MDEDTIDCSCIFGIANILHNKLSQILYLSENDFDLSVINKFGDLTLKNDRISSTKFVLIAYPISTEQHD